jgi:YbbR domain-containing protein
MATFRDNFQRFTAPLRRRLGAKLFATVCAFVLWFFVNAGERETQVMPFPIEMRNIPERAIQTNPDRVDTVQVRLNGPGPLLASLDTKRSPIVLDLSHAEIGTDFRLKVRDEMVRIPRGVRILDIEPSRIPVRLERVKRVSVPVTLAPVGEPRDGYKVQTLKATPEKVQVSGPASLVDRLTALETEPFDLTDLAASAQRTVGLVRADQLTVKPENVVVEISVAPVVTTREFKRLAVEVRNVDRPFQLKPTRVNLTVRGPQRVVQGLTLDEGGVYVDGTSYEPGEHIVEAEVTLPAGVEVVKRDPPVIRLEILEEPKEDGKSGARK